VESDLKSGLMQREEQPNNGRKLVRTLAGATTLHIVPTLSDEPAVRAVLNIAGALLRAGARTLIASNGGPLIPEFRARGAEWISFPSTNVNRWNLNRCANALEEIVKAERIDLVHALTPGGAACAIAVRERIPLRVITNLPDESAKRADNNCLAAFARGDRMIARSAFAAAPVIERYEIPDKSVAVIPHSVDTAKLDPASVRSDRVAKLREAWKVGAGERVFLAPGLITPESGHISLIDAVRVLVNGGLHGAVFVVPCDEFSEPKQIRAISDRAATQGIDALFRFSHPPTDMPTLFSAADVVVLPAVEPPEDSHLAAEAQALSRPVIASAIGVLTESLVAPPRKPGDLRTGWLVRSADPVDLARTIGTVLALDGPTLAAIGARARQFAELTFSPQSVAAATLAVYTSVLVDG
jgi:glycosyltransferase involved in cell wall biosynthesis